MSYLCLSVREEEQRETKHMPEWPVAYSVSREPKPPWKWNGFVTTAPVPSAGAAPATPAKADTNAASQAPTPNNPDRFCWPNTANSVVLLIDLDPWDDLEALLIILQKTKFILLKCFLQIWINTDIENLRLSNLLKWTVETWWKKKKYPES